MNIIFRYPLRWAVLNNRLGAFATSSLKSENRTIDYLVQFLEIRLKLVDAPRSNSFQNFLWNDGIERFEE